MNVRITFNPSMADLNRKFGDIHIEKWLATWVNEIALRIENESKQVTPVDTGRLRSSIHVFNAGSLRAFVNTDTEYAVYVHEGTRYMRARPFMEWGVQRVISGNGLAQDMSQDLEKYVQQAVK